MKFYRQCTLKSGNTEMTAWIEERGAIEGVYITLEDVEDTEQLWKVVRVYDIRMSAAAVSEAAHRSENWRKSVDI